VTVLPRDFVTVRMMFLCIVSVDHVVFATEIVHT